jgi:hypothetical protein
MTRARAAATATTLAVALAGYVATKAPPGPRSMRDFDPHRLASLELGMWQAYYAKENYRLFWLLVTMLREQYHYSWYMAAKEGYHLAQAAATFATARDHYGRVLPDLEAGYTAARDWLGATFDPAAVARAELAWWVARRIPDQSDAENVGGLIADEYALLYNVPRDAVLSAGISRARAGRLRDIQASAPDWATIGRLLDDSYLALRTALR